MSFKVGDRVRFELAHGQRPRWTANCDLGATGMWEDGEVVAVQSDKITVVSESCVSVWPLSGNDEYDPGQWTRPGYLRLVETTVYKAKKRCVCGAEAVYGRGCGAHSDWCDLA